MKQNVLTLVLASYPAVCGIKREAEKKAFLLHVAVDYIDRLAYIQLYSTNKQNKQTVTDI